MTEQEWLASDDPQALLVHLLHGPGLLLSRVPRIKEAWESKLCGEERWCLGVIPRGGDSSGTELYQIAVNITTPYRPVAAALLRDIVDNPFRQVRVSQNGRTAAEVMAGQSSVYGCCRRHADNSACDCLEMAGDILPEWLPPTVISLALGAYEERHWQECPTCKGVGSANFNGKFCCSTCHGTGRIDDGTLDPERLAILSDALEDAGCTEEALLRHLRGWEPCECRFHDGGVGMRPANATDNIMAFCNHCRKEVVVRGRRYPDRGDGWRPLRGPHVRGCSMLDLILGRE